MVGDTVGEAEAVGVAVGDPVGSAPPPHACPFNKQPTGEPDPDARNPNDTDPPGAINPFHDRFENVNRCPDDDNNASQYEPTDVPAGRSNTNDHDDTAVDPPFVIVYRPSQPEPQSDTLTNDAVTPAANAGNCPHTTPNAATNPATTATTNDLDRRHTPTPPTNPDIHSHQQDGPNY
ncbi:hypothetical protein FHR38_003936 [Micromonospora polyrhachis]|uniref:Uncharacterized protein n=1 Tax=Micromonospora polyrhachis TaxID=1282883 RepID=A0A7W7SSM9_9ACTN|nr:hypothetical protein [Micromonospora polyrhachis]